MRRLSSSADALKRSLLNHLRHRSYVKLAPSHIAGVGVIAVRDIPPDTDPFLPPNAHLLPPEPPCIAVHASELATLPLAVRTQLFTFFAALDDPRDPTGAARLRDATGGLVYGVNATGMERLDASWFLNHGEDPNVRYCEAAEDGAFNRYVTTREVRAGEELLTDYSVLCSELHAQTVGSAAPEALDARRERLTGELRAAEAAAEQLRRELQRLASL